jgi:hypothetical protein
MLRPATPLTILLLISFVFLLLSVLSTPVIHAIPIATYQGVNLGVFGYCKPDSCSGIRVGYTTGNLPKLIRARDFQLTGVTRWPLPRPGLWLWAALQYPTFAVFSFNRPSCRSLSQLGMPGPSRRRSPPFTFSLRPISPRSPHPTSPHAPGHPARLPG